MSGNLMGLVVATAMAVSACTVILFDQLREKYMAIAQLELTKNVQESSPQGKCILKSCLSSGEKNMSFAKKKKKRVHFAADVKDSKSNGEKYRRGYRNSCGKKVLDMPANRRALYAEILKDRVHHLEFFY
ncbi:putative phospholipase D alpha 1-like [Capsicum annuum]|nr:putative phospholipase D alpha 1-like [Capsicum annuum]